MEVWINFSKFYPEIDKGDNLVLVFNYLAYMDARMYSSST